MIISIFFAAVIFKVIEASRVFIVFSLVERFVICFRESVKLKKPTP